MASFDAVRETYGDAATPCANVENDNVFRANEAFKIPDHFLHEYLGFRPGNEDSFRNQEREGKELSPSKEVLDGLMSGPGFEQLSESGEFLLD